MLLYILCLIYKKSLLYYTASMKEKLAREKCVPCESGGKPLPREEVNRYLLELPEWKLEDDLIMRTFSFIDFAAAISFVNKIGEIAEDEGHHPDICFGWGYVKVTLFTHAVKGLSRNDFIMAAKIDLAAH